MLNNELLTKINDMVTKMIQENSIASDVANNVKAITTGIFTKLELVTRDEFEVQKKLLLDTARKLEELEQKLESLEQKFNAK
jgi:BMFP domain-containing protein YqiC